MTFYLLFAVLQQSQRTDICCTTDMNTSLPGIQQPAPPINLDAAGLIFNINIYLNDVLNISQYPVYLQFVLASVSSQSAQFQPPFSS
ncbi:MAG TPA: hypothetical protein VEP90_06960, partial [Methylomirabilota bacterium]|nr:hypothetical protein [Methylomirabilota bacterium]